MESAPKKNATRGKEQSRSSRRVTIAVYLFSVIGLAVPAWCATGGTAVKEESRADSRQVIAMIRETDYKRTEWMAGAQKRVTGTAPEASAAQEENAETAPVSPSARSRAPMPETVPVDAETSKQPAVVPLRVEGE